MGVVEGVCVCVCDCIFLQTNTSDSLWTAIAVWRRLHGDVCSVGG